MRPAWQRVLLCRMLVGRRRFQGGHRYRRNNRQCMSAMVRRHAVRLPQGW